MDIEKLIPNNLVDKERDNYIKKTIIPDESIDFLGLHGQDITFRFKTNRSVEKYDIIEHKNVKLIYDGNSVFIPYNYEKMNFIPKEYLLEEWEVQ